MYLIAMSNEFYNSAWPEFREQIREYIFREYPLRTAMSVSWNDGHPNTTRRRVEVWAVEIKDAGATWLKLYYPHWEMTKI